MTKEQWVKIGKGALVAAAGGLLTYASTVVIPAMQDSSSEALIAIAAFASVAVNVVRKMLEAWAGSQTARK